MDKRIIISAIIFFILGFLFNSLFMKNQSVKSVGLDKKTIQLNSPSPTPLPCGRDDRYIETKGASDEEILKEVFNNQEITKFVKDNCLWVFGSFKANLINKNEELIGIWGSGIGCLSCHPQTLYIFSNGQKVLEQIYDDPKIAVVKREGKLDALEIITPVRSNNEGLCCPTWGLKAIYEWFTYDNKSSLLQVSQIPVKYN